MNSVWPWFWFTKHCQGDAMNSCACVWVCKCLCECMCGSVQGYPLAKANKIWHPATHPVHSSSTRTQTRMHTDTHLTTHLWMYQTLLTHKLCNMKACVYLLCCGQDPRGCLLGSLGPALRDVINQFRKRWGEKQEESRGGTSPLGALPQRASTLLILEGF